MPRLLTAPIGPARRLNGGAAPQQVGLLQFLDWRRNGLLGGLFRNPADPRNIVLSGILGYIGGDRGADIHADQR